MFLFGGLRLTYLFCVCVYFVGFQAPQHLCRGQRKTCLSWLSCHVDSRDGQVKVSPSFSPSPSTPTLRLLEMYLCRSGCLQKSPVGLGWGSVVEALPGHTRPSSSPQS